MVISLSLSLCLCLSSTLFSELMEGMQQYFMTASLEADIHKAREQKRYSQNMKHDPRRLPFESDDFAPVSYMGVAIDRHVFVDISNRT